MPPTLRVSFEISGTKAAWAAYNILRAPDGSIFSKYFQHAFRRWLVNGNGNNKKKRRKLFIYGGIGLGIVLLIAIGVFAATRGGTKIDPSKLAKVEKGDLAKSVVATGKVTPITK